MYLTKRACGGCERRKEWWRRSKERKEGEMGELGRERMLLNRDRGSPMSNRSDDICV